MLNTDDIKSLSLLARIAISADEEEGLARDLDSVLGYVSEVSAIATEEDTLPRAGELKNVMRPDEHAYEGGGFTEAILGNAPSTEDGYVKVPKII